MGYDVCHQASSAHVTDSLELQGAMSKGEGHG